MLIVALSWTNLEAADPPEGSAAKTAPKESSAGQTAPASGAGVEEVPSTLDQALAKAMENHPDIAAAKAKLTLAEAELNSKRLEVAQKVIALWNEREAHKAERETAQRARLAVPGSVPSHALIAAAAKLAKSEMELRYLTGKAVPGATRAARSQAAASRPWQIPRGPVVEKVRKALSSPTQMEFVDETLLNLLDYLKDYHKIEIHVDSKAFESEGIAVGKEIVTVNTKGGPLAAALQLMEDQRPPMKFVVRDYGILVTTSRRSEEEDFFPAVEFADLSEGDETAVPSRPSEPAGPTTRLPAKKAGTRPKPSADSDPFAPPRPNEVRPKSTRGAARDPFSP